MDFTSIFAWARQTLGLSASDTVSIADGDLQTYASSEVSAVVDLYPCIADTDGNVTLSGNDLTNFQEAIGILTGNRYLMSPGGRNFAAKMTSVTVGPIKETYAELDIPALSKQNGIDAQKALLRISCIKSTMKFVPLADLNGYRRTHPECNVPLLIDAPGVDSMLLEQ